MRDIKKEKHKFNCNFEVSAMKIRKNIVCIAMLLAAVFTFSFSVTASSGTKNISATYKNIKIILNGNEVVPKDVNGNVVEPFVSNGTTYLPIRAVGGALGMDVEWNGENSSVILTEKSIETSAALESLKCYDLARTVVNVGYDAKEMADYLYNSVSLSFSASYQDRATISLQLQENLDKKMLSNIFAVAATQANTQEMWESAKNSDVKIASQNLTKLCADTNVGYNSLTYAYQYAIDYIQNGNQNSFNMYLANLNTASQYFQTTIDQGNEIGGDLYTVTYNLIK